LKRKSILFITTSNLASNPRLLKELHLSTTLFEEIQVVQFKIGGWSDEITEKLKLDLPQVNFIELNAIRKPFLKWLIVSVQEWLLKKVNYKLLNEKFLSFSLNKRSILLHQFLKKLNVHYTWTIAHNPGAFYPAFIFSTRNNCKLGLDIEDYHPGEYNDSDLTNRMLKMMEYVLPKADYCSFAAPLIQREFEKYIFHDSNNWFIVINGFPRSEFIEPIRTESAKLTIIWFSQNISPGRGLENFISVIEEFEDDIELHLVGELSDDNRKLLFNGCNNIMVHAPMNQMDLHHFLSTFSVGLVTDPPINRNRELAITNKIIAYSQAGLYILSVSADGHNQFLKESELNYLIVENDKKEIKQALLYLIANYYTIVDSKHKQYEYGDVNAWESINSKLIETWQN
jgi:glycosyltransferase involved in cell wall biosynthesis